METRNIVNFFTSSENEFSKFVHVQKWYVIDSETKGNYSHKNSIKCLTDSLEGSLCDYSNAYISVTGNITVTRTIASAGNDPDQINQPPLAATQVAFKNCAPFKSRITEINDTFVDEADFINVAMPMYNLIEYSDNYSDNSGSLLGF